MFHKDMYLGLLLALAVYYSHLVMLVNIQQILLIKGAKHHRCKINGDAIVYSEC